MATTTPWLDLSAYGLRLQVIAAPDGRSVLYMAGSTDAHRRALIALGFQRTPNGHMIKPDGKLAAAAALANNANQVGTKVLIAAGTYRESIALLKNGRETDAPIVFEAAGEVIVSGSEVWTGWQKMAHDNVYAHAWHYTWGLAPVPPGWEPHVKLKDIVRRSEMVFVNGAPLDQVLSHSELQAGRFFADEKAQKIYMRLPEGLPVDNAAVEVAVRPKLFAASGKKKLFFARDHFSAR